MHFAPQETLNVVECAALLRCAPEDAAEMAHAGEIPAIKIGADWIFMRTDLLQFLGAMAREQAEHRRSVCHRIAAPVWFQSQHQQPSTLMVLSNR